MIESENNLGESKEQQRTFSSAQEMLRSLKEARSESEDAVGQQIEHNKSSEGEFYTECRKLLTDEGRAELLAKTEAALAEPEMQQIAAIEEESEEVGRRFFADEIDGETFSSRRRELSRQLYEAHNKSRVSEQRSLVEQRTKLEQGMAFISGEAGQDFVDNMLKTAENKDATNYAHAFISPDSLKSFERSADVRGDKIEVEAKTEIHIPLGMFVSAESFESWRGRPEGDYKDNRPSSEVIEDYAERSTKAPAVESLTGYVLPDGRAYFKSANSHRVAAAILRGDERIAVEGRIKLCILNENAPEF